MLRIFLLLMLMLLLLLRFWNRARGDAHDLGDHVEQRFRAAGGALTRLHVEAARVGQRGVVASLRAVTGGVLIRAGGLGFGSDCWICG